MLEVELVGDEDAKPCAKPSVTADIEALTVGFPAKHNELEALFRHG